MRTLAFLLLATVALAPQAQTLRWTNQGNYLTADPHAQNTIITFALNSHVYDRLVLRGKKVEPVPGLATKWERKNPTTWVFHLRKGVKFSDGTPFTADDVVFSVLRAQGTTSGYRSYAAALGAPKKVDAHTVEFTTPAPNPIAPDLASMVQVMSKAWAEKHKVERAQDFANKEETYASRHAMGTGAYVLVSHEQDVKTVLKRNPDWWGNTAGYFEGNVQEVVYTPIASDATRGAALSAGSVDFVLDPSPQDIERLRKDPRVKVYEGAENTVMFLAMDQDRGELLYSSVKGKNPFKDIRVRRAMYLAIDVEALTRTALRGFGQSTPIPISNPDALPFPPAMLKRPAHDLAAAKKLLADAGYAQGFSVTMDCDARLERTCTAVAAMLAKIGIELKLAMAPPGPYYAKLRRLDSSFYIMGWVSSQDTMFALQALYHSYDAANGDWNIGRIKDAKMDAAIDAAKTELDEPKRQALMIEAVKAIQDNVYVIPLYRRLAPWASRANVGVTYRSDMTFEARWATVK